MELHEVSGALVAPFPAEAVEVKPGATTRDKTKALALAYCDSRVYQARLDETVGTANWADDYQPMPSGTATVAILCRLTILGVTKADVGESPANDPNAWTSAAAQAFKRAASKFGIGRYLYHLPQLWTEYDDQKKQIVNAPGVVHKLYYAAGLADRQPKLRSPDAPRLVKPAPDLARVEARFWEKFGSALAPAGQQPSWTHVYGLLKHKVTEPQTIDEWKALADEVDAKLTAESEVAA